MLKIACSFTGDNFDLLSANTPASKKKVVAMALAMMVPVLIWVFNGFMLSKQVLKSGWLWAIITAFVCGIIVFLIEKLIIMAKGNNCLTTIRILIGIVVAFLGSVAIDEVVFGNDIDICITSIKENVIVEASKKAAANFNELNPIDEINNKILIAQEQFDKAETAAIAEADGSQGTKNRGIGIVAKFKDKKAQWRKQELDNLILKKGYISTARDSVVNFAAIKTRMSFNENALLVRIKALFKLVASDGYVLTVYVFFTLLMFFFEFLVVILKLSWEKTNYELKIEMIEEIGKKRMEFLLRQDSPVLDAGNYLPQLEQARNAIKKNFTMYN
ncbi:hypothetical protein BH11BAC3_BH11BAC3_07580 [soil metagenome]